MGLIKTIEKGFPTRGLETLRFAIGWKPCYEGNRLQAVDDSIAGTCQLEDFNDNGYKFDMCLNGCKEYLYDENGNMTFDFNKGTNIVYYLENNLPQYMINENSLIQNIYTADGLKLEKRCYTDRVNLISDERYLGNLVLEGDIPRRIIHPDGTVEFDPYNTNTLPEFMYHLKDHLGDVVAVISPDRRNDPVKVQTTDYYPFGMALSSAPGANKYLYNGKEAQTEMTGNWLDYGARFYDPTLGRWHSVDPLAESSRRWSPYTYCMDNPIRFIDPDGMVVDGYGVDNDGNVKFLKEKEGPDELYKIDENKNKVDIDGDGKLIENKDFITVEDKDLLPQLESGQKIEWTDAEGKIIDESYDRKAFANASSANDVLETFTFVADNTNVEWNVELADIGGQKQYGISSWGDDDSAPNCFAPENTIVSLHSHPNPKTQQAELGSLYGDKMNSLGRGYLQYVYMKNSSNLYNVQNGEGSFIRNINRDYKRFINMK